MSTVLTHQVTIWMAGDIATAHRVVREFCYVEGACFTVTPSKFIYTGGEEDGFAIGFVNYPKYPRDPWKQTEALARKLLPACNQRTCLLVCTNETKLIAVEPPGTLPPKVQHYCPCSCACTGINLEDECTHRVRP